MKILSEKECKNVIGGAYWNCNVNGFKSAYHGTWKSAESAAYNHEKKYKHWGRTWVSSK